MFLTAVHAHIHPLEFLAKIYPLGSGGDMEFRN